MISYRKKNPNSERVKYLMTGIKLALNLTPGSDMRPLALDGSYQSLVNTPHVTFAPSLIKHQKGQPGAMPEFMSVRLIEFGTRQPLGAQY